MMRLPSTVQRFRENRRRRGRFCENVATDSEKPESCDERAYVTCPHCQRSLCLFHINEHQRLIRSLFDSLVNRLNEYRYQLTATLEIPPEHENLVNECLDELKNSIIPYVQRTSCNNDVKQEDLNRLQIFIDKIQNVAENILSFWNIQNSQKKRLKTADVRNESKHTFLFVI